MESAHKEILTYLVAQTFIRSAHPPKHLLCTRRGSPSYNDATMVRKASVVPALMERAFQGGEVQTRKTRERGEQRKVHWAKGRGKGCEVTESTWNEAASQMPVDHPSSIHTWEWEGPLADMTLERMKWP